MPRVTAEGKQPFSPKQSCGHVTLKPRKHFANTAVSHDSGSFSPHSEKIYEMNVIKNNRSENGAQDSELVMQLIKAMNPEFNINLVKFC